MSVAKREKMGYTVGTENREENMKTHDFWYDLPEELIAQTPLERRDGSRLMVLNRETGEIQHKHFYDVIDYLNPGDCLVMNDSRVLPARLMGHRPTGGVVEVLLLRDLGNKCWECLCKPGRKMQVGNEVIFGDGELTAVVREVREDGNRVVEFRYEGIFLEVLERLGKMPLPPYIKEEEKKDMERNVLDYEPHLALFVPDNDPLLYYWHIAHFGKKKLRRNGHLYFEINAACGNMVVEMLEEEGYKNIELIQDLSGRDRIIKARK